MRARLRSSRCDREVEREGSDARRTVFRARYRLALKGTERGKWEMDITEEADAPTVTVDEVVRGVLERAGDVRGPGAVERGGICARSWRMSRGARRRRRAVEWKCRRACDHPVSERRLQLASISAPANAPCATRPVRPPVLADARCSDQPRCIHDMSPGNMKLRSSICHRARTRQTDVRLRRAANNRVVHVSNSTEPSMSLRKKVRRNSMK